MTQQELENKIIYLEKQVIEMQDRHAIEMLMGDYHIRHIQKNMSTDILPKYFALSMPDVLLEIGDIGKFVGAANIRNLYQNDYHNQVFKGKMLIHWLTSQMIEVAKDGKTAKGVWQSPGAEAEICEDGTRQALWNFIIYACDFIKENGQWRIWHMYVFNIIKCDYQKGWCNDYYNKWVYKGKYNGADDSAPTWHHPYSPTYVQQDFPAGPKPYDTFTDDSWMFEYVPNESPFN